MSEASQPDRPAAVRLIFEYEGDQVRLVAQQRVDVVSVDSTSTSPRCRAPATMSRRGTRSTSR